MKRKAKELEQWEGIIETESKMTLMQITNIPEVDTLRRKKMVVWNIISVHNKWTFSWNQEKSEFENQNYTFTPGNFHIEQSA